MNVLIKIAQSLLALLGFQVAQSVINKAILVGLFTLVLPVVLNNLLYFLLNKIMMFVNANVSVGSGDAITYQFTGLGAYIANEMYLPTCVGMFLSAISLRFALRFIKVV
jgi:hypothetical protein